MNLLDSHDVPRALHSLNNDVAALKLALLLLFLHPGAPSIYYGTEAALAGGPEPGPSSGPGPACREAYPWDVPWSVDLRPFIQSLAELRSAHGSCAGMVCVGQPQGLTCWRALPMACGW